jgi:hypothetical protein
LRHQPEHLFNKYDSQSYVWNRAEASGRVQTVAISFPSYPGPGLFACKIPDFVLCRG